MSETKTPIAEKKINKKYIFAVGRRKEAVARVRLYTSFEDVKIAGREVKKGELFVNNLPIDQYFRSAEEKVIYTKPLRTTNTIDKFTITIQVSGGGKMGQLDATVMGIARTLSLYDKDKFRFILKKANFLTRDSRVRERRKVGMGGKARRKRQSPKR